MPWPQSLRKVRVVWADDLPPAGAVLLQVDIFLAPRNEGCSVIAADAKVFAVIMKVCMILLDYVPTAISAAGLNVEVFQWEMVFK